VDPFDGQDVAYACFLLTGGGIPSGAPTRIRLVGTESKTQAQKGWISRGRRAVAKEVPDAGGARAGDASGGAIAGGWPPEGFGQGADRARLDVPVGEDRMTPHETVTIQME
jgi:hypothetical protein